MAQAWAATWRQPRRRTEVRRFLSVGLAATLITVVGFNVLVHLGAAPLRNAPVAAFVASFALGTLVAFVGNRRWTFPDRQVTRLGRGLVSFAVLNAAALAIPVMALWFSRHILGLQSFWADNVAANGVGLILATCFRYWSYRRWIFRA